MSIDIDTLWREFEESLTTQNPKASPSTIETFRSIFFAGAWAAAWQFSRHTDYSDEWAENFRAEITQRLDAFAKPVMEELVQ